MFLSFLTDKELMDNPLNRLMFDEAIIMVDNDASVKYSLHDAVKLLLHLNYEYLKKDLNLIFKRCFES